MLKFDDSMILKTLFEEEVPVETDPDTGEPTVVEIHKIIIRKTVEEDLDSEDKYEFNRIKDVYKTARETMEDEGDYREWARYYPENDLIEDDIRENRMYLICFWRYIPIKEDDDADNKKKKKKSKDNQDDDKIRYEIQETIHAVYVFNDHIERDGFDPERYISDDNGYRKDKEFAAVIPEKYFTLYTGSYKTVDDFTPVESQADKDLPDDLKPLAKDKYGRVKYASLERIASDGELSGVFPNIVSYVSDFACCLLLETNDLNVIMNKLLERYGFEKAGMIIGVGHIPSTAYQYFCPVPVQEEEFDADDSFDDATPDEENSYGKTPDQLSDETDDPAVETGE